MVEGVGSLVEQRGAEVYESVALLSGGGTVSGQLRDRADRVRQTRSAALDGHGMARQTTTAVAVGFGTYTRRFSP